MSTQITISNDFPLKEIKSVIQKIADAQVVSDKLKAIDNSVSKESLSDLSSKDAYRRGYVYGALKANLDCLPKVYYDKQYVGDQSLDRFIKLKVNTYVASVANLNHPDILNADSETLYWILSQIVCGMGFVEGFSEKNFSQFFPYNASHFMHGFSEGYALVFYTMARNAGIKTVHINPKEQGIWKNIGFFTDPDKYDYRLDGNFLFPFGCVKSLNESEDRWHLFSNVLIGTEKEVNTHVYDRLEAREIYNFISCFLPLDF